MRLNNGIIIHTRAIIILSNPNYMLCTWLRVLSEVSVSARKYDPYCLWGPSTYTWRQKQWLFCCVPSGVGLPRLFVMQFSIQGSLESGASARAIFVIREHKSTNMTCNKHMH